MNYKNNIYLLSIDIGTTHTKAILYQHGVGIIGQETESYTTYYPLPGFVEQDPEEIFAAVLKATQRLINNSLVPPHTIAALVFGGIWQSLLPVDREGNALCHATTWADKRSIAQNERLKARLDTEEVKQRTGCTLHPMYFLSRLMWIRDEIPDVYKHASRFISIKEYIINRLFGTHRVDHSIASGTGIWNMRAMNWDYDLLSEINLSPDRFSESVEPTCLIPGGLRREYASRLGLPEGTPGVIGASDGALSHLGSVGLAADRMSLSVGTGAALRRRMLSPHVLPESEAWCYYLAEGNWLLGGVLHNAGNVLRWFADNLMPPSEVEEEPFSLMKQLAEETPAGADGLFFIPLLSGERCPHYRPDAKGVVFGLTFSHNRGHLVRALMEGIAYNLYSVYRMLAPDLEPELVVTGGILKSPILLKIVANFFGKTLWLPQIQEVAAWGGVILGLKAIGALSNLEESVNFVDVAGKQDPDSENQEFYQELIDEYDRLNTEIYSLVNKKNKKEIHNESD
jgi:Sugar (pentulose and hexulose) kinases